MVNPVGGEQEGASLAELRYLKHHAGGRGGHIAQSVKLPAAALLLS